MAQLGFVGVLMQAVEVIVPPVCAVPAGVFTMGSDSHRDPLARANQIPHYQIYLPTGAHSAFRGSNTPELVNTSIGTRLARGGG